MTGNNMSEDQLAIDRINDAPDDPFDPQSPDLPPKVRRLAEWVIGIGVFPDPDSAERWLWDLEQMTRPWLRLTGVEFRAKTLARFTGPPTGTDEDTRHRADVLRVLDALIDNPGDDNPLLATGCGTMTAAQVAELRDWVEGIDYTALDRRAEELRAVFEADEAYQERVAEWRAEGWELLPPWGWHTYMDMPCDWFVGKEVKVGFESNLNVEHMWVAVTAVEGEHLVGELVSDPVLIRAVQPGDRVELERSQIQEVVKVGDES